MASSSSRLVLVVCCLAHAASCGIVPASNPYDPEAPLEERLGGRVVGRLLLPGGDLNEPRKLFVEDRAGERLRDGQGEDLAIQTRTPSAALPTGFVDDDELGAGGTFEIELPPGTYAFGFDAGANAEPLFDDALVRGVEVFSGGVTQIEIAPPQRSLDSLTGAVAGEIRGASAGSFVVRLLPTTARAEGEQLALMSGDGAFRFTRVPPGEYTVAVVGEGYAPSSTGAFQVGDGELSLPAPLELTALGAIFRVSDWDTASGLPPFSPYLPAATASIAVGPLVLFDADAPVTAYARLALAGDDALGDDEGWQPLSPGAAPFEVDLDASASDGPRTIVGQLRLCFGGTCECTVEGDEDCLGFRPPLLSAQARVDVVVDRAPPEVVSVTVSGETGNAAVVVNCERFAGAACPVSDSADPYRAPLEGVLLDGTSRVVGWAAQLDDDAAPATFTPLFVAGGVATFAGEAPSLEAADATHELSLWAMDAAGNVGLVHARELFVDVTAIELGDPALLVTGTRATVLSGDVAATEVLPGSDALVDVAFLDEAPASWRVVDAGGSANVTGAIVGALRPYLGPEPVRVFGAHLDDAQIFVEALDAAGNVSSHLLPRTLLLHRAASITGRVVLENAPAATGVRVDVVGDGGVAVAVLAGEDLEVDVGAPVPVRASFSVDGSLALLDLPVPDNGVVPSARFTVTITGPSPYGTTTRTVTLAPLAELGLGDVVLSRPRGDLEGRFVLAGRESAATNSGIQVTLANSLGQDVAGASTLANGGYRFSGVPADTGYRVVAYREGYAQAEALGVEVAAGSLSVVEPDDAGLPTPIVLGELVGDFTFCASTGVLQETCAPLLFTNADAVDIGGLSLDGIADLRASTTPFGAADATPAWTPVTPSGASYVAPAVALDGLPDGDVTVYLQLRQSVGNEGPVLSSSLTYDTSPPAGVAVIARSPSDARPGFTRFGTVDVVVTANAPAQGTAPLKDARVAFAASPPGALPSFSCAHSTPCATPLDNVVEGEHRAYAFSCDAAGNCSSVSAPAAIVLDTTPPRVANGAGVAPTAPWVAADGAGFVTRSAQYDVDVEVGSALTAGGVAVLDTSGNPVVDVVAARFSLLPSMTGASFSTFEPLPAPGGSFVLGGPALPAVDGTNTVTAQLRDAAGNVSSLEPSPFSFALSLDTTPPAAAFSISSDAVATSSTTVTLTVSSPSPGGAVRVWLNQTGVFDASDPSTYEERALPLSSTSYTLTAPAAPGGDGAKSVYARFFDAAGNSVDRSDSILLDRTAPVALSVACGSCVVSSSGVVATNASTRLAVIDVLASDNSGAIAAVETQVDGGAVTTHGYTGSVTVTLPNSDTTHAVSVVFVDAAGNRSAAASLSILLDRAAPTAPALVVTGLAADGVPSTTLTRTLEVTLAPSASGATEMMVSSYAGFPGASWQSYATSLPWVLPPGDSTSKQVFVKFRDDAGNTTSSVAGTITLDQTAPTSPTMLLANGADYITSNSNVPVATSAVGATQMRLSSDGVFDTEVWGNVLATTTMNLPTGQGLKRGYVVFRDAAGNESAVVSDTVELDSLAPTTPTLVIDGGAAFAKSVSVTVSLSAVGASEMRLSTDGTFDGEPWVPFQSATTVLLPSGDCPSLDCKTVSAHFRDAAGNATASAVFDNITLDATAPTIPLITTPSLVTSGAQATITIAAAVNETFFLRYEVAGGASCYPGGFTQLSTTRTQTSFTVCLDEKTGDTDPTTSLFENTIRLRAVDQAGNVSVESSVVVVRDTIAPATPELATLAEVVNATLYPVSLSTSSQSHLDATFLRYELRGGAFASFTPTAQLDQLTFTLLQGDGGGCGSSCANLLEVRAVDEAGNTSGTASVTITEDSLPPPAPVLEIDAAEVNASRVVVQMTSPRPADASQEPNFSHYEIRGGALVDFVAVCPSATARCSEPLALVGESDRYLFADADGDGVATATEIAGLFFALEDESADELAIRAVDLAGNTSFASSAYVEERSEVRLTEVFAARYGPAVHGDRIVYGLSDPTKGTTVVILSRGDDARFGTSDDVELEQLAVGVIGANGLYPDIHGDRVIWHDQESGQNAAIWMRSAGADHVFGGGDDGPGPSTACNCSGSINVQLTPTTSAAQQGRLFKDSLVYRSSGGVSGLVLVEAASCGEFCPLGLSGTQATRTVTLAGTTNGYYPDIYDKVVVFLDDNAGTCSLKAIHAGADDSLGTGDDVTNTVDSNVDCYPRPAVFAPFSAAAPGDENVIAYFKSSYVNIVRAGTNGRFDSGDTKVATAMRAWNVDVDRKSIVAGGHSNGLLFRQHAGEDGLLGTGDDVLTSDSYAYGFPREVAIGGDLYVYRSNDRGTTDIIVRELGETKWLYTSGSGNDRLPQISGDLVAFGRNTSSTFVLDIESGRTFDGATLPVGFFGGYVHHSISGQRVLGNLGNELHVWQAGSDGVLGTADDTKATIAAGSTVYLANQAPDSLSSPALQLSGDVAVWLDQDSDPNLAYAGADGVFGNGSGDCSAEIEAPAGSVYRVRASGTRAVYDRDNVVRAREVGAGGLCSTGDDVVADISSGVSGILAATYPDIDGTRVVFVCNVSGSYGICMVEPGPDGSLTSTADNVGSVLVRGRSFAHLPIVSGDYVAWLDYFTGAPEVMLLHIPDGALANVSRQPGDRQQLDMQNGRVVWSDVRLGTFDVWSTELP